MTEHAHALETATGLDHRKLAIWIFIGSECMFFGTLISTYLVYKGKSLVGPAPPRDLEHPAHRRCRATFDPAVCRHACCCSLALVVPRPAARRRATGRCCSAGSATDDHLRRSSSAVAGVRVHPLRARGAHAAARNLFGASFFVLTGFHGTHVTLGVIWLLTLWILALRGKLTAGTRAQPRDGGAVLALRGRGLDRDLHRRLPDP